MPRAKKTIREIPLLIPNELDLGKVWVVGLDLSLSRTGYAISTFSKENQSSIWCSIGSIKPDLSNNPVWLRSKLLALYVKDLLTNIPKTPEKQTLILSFEQAPPGNDWLSSLNRVFHVVLLEDGNLADRFDNVYLMHTNASTLRSVMGLVKKGAKNKVENIAKGYEFISSTSFPSLDSDACDGVLLAVMGTYAAMAHMDLRSLIPTKALETLCNSTLETKGKGNRARIQTKGLLHRPEYWTKYEYKPYVLAMKDAKVSGNKRLIRTTISL